MSLIPGQHGPNVQEGRVESEYRRNTRHIFTASDAGKIALTLLALTGGAYALNWVLDKATRDEGNYVSVQCTNRGLVSEWAQGNALRLTEMANPDIPVDFAGGKHMYAFMRVPDTNVTIGLPYEGTLRQALDQERSGSLQRLASEFGETDAQSCQDLNRELKEDPAAFRDKYESRLEALTQAYQTLGKHMGPRK